MTSDNSEKSPFTRPGFIAAAIVVALIVVCGIILAIVMFSRPADPPQPTATSSAAPAPSPTAAAGGSSVCGLEGVELTGTVTQAPPTTWEYQGTTAYPTSADFGPAETDPSGFRYCFQHTPNGALFMAANAVAQGSDSAVSDPWSQYVVAEGTYRAELLSQVGTPSSTAGTRTSVAGFRVLDYDGTSATVDLAVTSSSQGQAVTVSAVYSLTWQGGDWKISSDTPAPVDVASIPNLAGYIAWGE